MAETGSTNADVLALAREGAGEGLVLVADHQTAGRGRSGRTWTAPPGASLLCTILLRPHAPVAGLVTTALAVAAARAVEDVAGVRVGLKWPNDLVVESPGDEVDGQPRTRKLAGILAEAEWPAGSHIAAGYREPAPHERVTVAAGIGLNVAWGDDVPAELADVAVALDHVSDARPTRDEVLEALLDHLDDTYGRLVSGDVASVLGEWRDRSATLGRLVRVDLGTDDVVGTAVDVTEGGHLVVETLEGEARTLAVGDVVHLRPA